MAPPPPPKVARVNESERQPPEEEATQDPEERSRRVARRLSNEPDSRSRRAATPSEVADTAAETSDDIIVVDEVLEEAANESRARADSLESTASAVRHVALVEQAGRSGGPISSGRGRFPTGDDVRIVAERTDTAESARQLREPPSQEIVTQPENAVELSVSKPAEKGFKLVRIMANFVRAEPMSHRHIYQYRVEFEPNVESKAQRRWFFHEATQNIFSKKPGFDGMHDIYCAQKLEKKVTVMNVDHPSEPGKQIKLTITCVSEVDWNGFEMMRVYNVHMKKLLHLMGFYQATANGSWVHQNMATPIGDGRVLSMVRGYRTSVNILDGNKTMVQLESVHKLMQRRNVLQVMRDIRAELRPGENLQEAVTSELMGKLVITNYNKRIYRIESIRWDVKPLGTFSDKRDDKQISYVEYYERRHALKITDLNQPMLQVQPNNRKSKTERGNEGFQNDILLVPELCNITGLTENQRNDNRLKMVLIKSSQVAPKERIAQLKSFLEMFHSNVEVRDALKEWGYSYSKEPVKIMAHVLPPTRIGTNNAREGQFDTYSPVNPTTGDFNVTGLAKAPRIERLVIYITRPDLKDERTIIDRLKGGFTRVRLTCSQVQVIKIEEGDAPAHYISYLRRMEREKVTVAIVVMRIQNKEKYDVIKKTASVERGIVTQCVTSRLLCDEKKGISAATKIAIQVAAKIGGEPWWCNIPLKGAMICGYDTFRDTTKRGTNFGAFLASMNDTYSRWFSQVNAYEQQDQISVQLTECYSECLKKYREVNNCYPSRVFIYRDGVGEGGLAQVCLDELKRIREITKFVDEKIMITLILVNKRVGARFYMNERDQWMNPPPGTVIDHTVTRQNRYDFYLISQSTRQGTISPTYYNIIHDDAALKVEQHQQMAYRLSLMYFNWTGTVRVPAPCQYAHKLAALCGEHLHSEPNVVLNDRLHFL